MDWANRVTDACETPARAASAPADSRAASAGSASTVSATSRSAPVSLGATVRIRSVRPPGSVTLNVELGARVIIIRSGFGSQ